MNIKPGDYLKIDKNVFKCYSNSIKDAILNEFSMGKSYKVLSVEDCHDCRNPGDCPGKVRIEGHKDGCWSWLNSNKSVLEDYLFLWKKDSFSLHKERLLNDV